MTYSVNDIAERYGVSTGTVLHWISTGQLRALNVGVDPGKRKPRFRVTEVQLAEFETARSTVPAVAPARRRKRDHEVVEFYK